MITTTDPRTGTTTETTIEPTSADAVTAIAASSSTAFEQLREFSREHRARLLEAMADALEADRELLVTTAISETGLAETRLDGELTRSIFQFRLFAEAVRDGAYLEAAIDHAGTTPVGPAPDVRRMLVPIGPVAVFGSSNFPFAFSVAGGDTASALAAGNPVVAKAHSSHPETSRRSFDALSRAAAAVGAPAGTLGIVYGQAAGAALVAADQIAAVGFTGSKETGEILLGIIAGRERPIPFYGELSSLNPLVITPGAAAERADTIADGLFASVTGSGGQLCTKPGIAFVPRSASALVDRLAGRASEAAAPVLLNRRISSAFSEISERLVAGGATVIAQGHTGDVGYTATPTVLGIDAAAITPAVTEEAFGPLIVLAVYDDVAEIGPALDAVPDSLTASIHSAADESVLRARLVDLVQDRVGRIVFDGFPTGVRVSWAQHHGGPWPATNTVHTSVGVTAIRRFLRPLAWQDAPQDLLPQELRDGVSSIPRRVDGVLELPDASAARRTARPAPPSSPSSVQEIARF